MTTTRKQAPAPERTMREMGAALTAIGKDLRTGGTALYEDVKTLVGSARTDTVKLGKALRGDVERLVKAGTSVPKREPLPRVPARKRRAAAPTKQAAA